MRTFQEERMVIEDRFRGLPDIVHGGYLAGVMASALGAAEAEFRHRRPARPGRLLDIGQVDSEVLGLWDGDMLLASGSRTELELEVPASVSSAEAGEAAAGFLGHHHHQFPYCFVCGTGRDARDGLRVFPGPVTGRQLVAAPWVPAGDGFVPDRLVWAAFDCTQLWSLIVHAPADTTDRVVTSSLAARIDQPVVAGEEHVIIGWPIGHDDRSWTAGAALFGPDGDLLAVGRQQAAITDWGVPLNAEHWGG